MSRYPVEDINLTEFTRTLTALADPVRMRILNLMLSEGQISIKQISRMFKLEPSTTKRHLTYLEDADLVATFMRGHERCFTLRKRTSGATSRIVRLTLALIRFQPKMLSDVVQFEKVRKMERHERGNRKGKKNNEIQQPANLATTRHQMPLKRPEETISLVVSSARPDAKREHDLAESAFSEITRAADLGASAGSNLDTNGTHRTRR